MCARVYLNGDGMGKGTHLSLVFVIMRGEYYARLPWLFKQKVTLMLMDQGSSPRHLGDAFKPDPNSSSFKKPTGEMNIASGCPVFVVQTVLENGTYIKDDTILRKNLVEQRKQPEEGEEEAEQRQEEPHVKTDPNGFSNRLDTLTLKNYLSIIKINIAVR